MNLSKTCTAELQASLLLLEENRHRQANEYAAALASLQLVKAGLPFQNDLIDLAISRLHNQVRLERFLLGNQPSDLGSAVGELAELISKSRVAGAIFDVKTVGVPKPVANSARATVLLVLYELLLNVAKHADTSMVCRVRCAWRANILVLTIANQAAPNTSKRARFPSDGMRIVQRLLDQVDGKLVVRRDAHIHVAQVHVPYIVRLAHSGGEG